MKPRIGILGQWNKEDVQGLPFDFVPLGYGHRVIPGLDESLADWILPKKPSLDLLIIQDMGGGLLHWASKFQELKDKIKVVFWSYDSHHDHEREKRFAHLFNAVATAHSWTVPLIGPNAFWCPCSLVFHAQSDFIPAPERWYDYGFVGRRYWNTSREKTLNQWREWLEATGHKVFNGESDPASIPYLYQRTKCVLNPCVKNDLNIRFFEALAAGCRLLMTDCDDLHQERFRDLTEAVTVLPPSDIGFEAFRECLRTITPVETQIIQRQIVFKKHTLLQRYIEIANHVL